MGQARPFLASHGSGLDRGHHRAHGDVPGRHLQDLRPVHARMPGGGGWQEGDGDGARAGPAPAVARSGHDVHGMRSGPRSLFQRTRALQGVWVCERGMGERVGARRVGGGEFVIFEFDSDTASIDEQMLVVRLPPTKTPHV